MSAYERNKALAESMSVISRCEREEAETEKFERMRDRLAMAALPEILREFNHLVREQGTPYPENWRHGIALDAYKIADAMIDIRGAK